MQDPQPRTFHSPKQRQYEERDRGRDVDEADRINRLRALVWSLVIFIVALPEGIFHYIQRKYHQFERWVEVEK